MGHTPGMNDKNYKKRQSTQTTIDLLLNSKLQRYRLRNGFCRRLKTS